jgi:hypothetical protein
MGIFEEWQGHPQTKEFVESLKKSREELKEALLNLNGLTVEQIAIAHLEIQTEARVLNDVIELLTKKEEQDE